MLVQRRPIIHSALMQAITAAYRHADCRAFARSGASVAGDFPGPEAKVRVPRGYSLKPSP